MRCHRALPRSMAVLEPLDVLGARRASVVVIGILSAVASVPSGVAGRIRSWRAGLLQSPDEEAESISTLVREPCPFSPPSHRARRQCPSRVGLACQAATQGYPEPARAPRCRGWLRARRHFPKLADDTPSGRQRRKMLVKFQNPQNPDETWTGIGRSQKWVQVILSERGINMSPFKGIPMYQIHC